jgi:hypothetical protein
VGGAGLDSDTGHLEDLDQRFVAIYEAARAKVLEQQQQKALIVIDDDVLLLYREDHAVQRFPGLRPPLYVKMKTLGHMPLAVYCLLRDQTGTQLSRKARAAIGDYAAAVRASAADLDTHKEAALGLLPRPCPIPDKALAILDTAIADAGIPSDTLTAFAHGVRADILPVLAAAARVQLDACNEHVTRIRNEILTPEQWRDIRVLVLGPYMARQGQNFLQYFAHLLGTPMHGDKRLVYFDGDDIGAAFDRLGTTMLDAEASAAIFGNSERLHRDVLADATSEFLRDLNGAPRASA